MSEDQLYAIALSVISSPSSKRLWDKIHLLKPSEIYRRLSINCNLKTQHYLTKKYSYDPVIAAKQIFEESESKSIKIIDYWDNKYPELLKEIYSPPLVIYWEGDIISNKMVAIVGTRKSDKRSENITEKIASDLSCSGYTIVSGMAIGIDRMAHLAALENNMSTIGVLANGIDLEYPSANRDVYKKIRSSKCSALLSEYPPGILAGRWTFVRRNRIISGLSMGTVIIKAGQKSGALITARYALEQNREVFVCPGNSFDESYEGCNNLIKNGAVLVSCTNDILDELPDFSVKSITSTNDPKPLVLFSDNTNNYRDIEISDNFLLDKNSAEQILFDSLTSCEDEIDSIIRKLDFTTNEINEAIMSLELSGKIIRNGNLISKAGC